MRFGLCCIQAFAIFFKSPICAAHSAHLFAEVNRGDARSAPAVSSEIMTFGLLIKSLVKQKT